MTTPHEPFRSWRKNLPDALTPKQAAEALTMSVGHLANLRSQGRGPRWHKPAGRVIYEADDLLHYVIHGDDQ